MATRVTIPPEAKAAYGEMQKGLRQLARSIGDVQKSLRQAERRIEADARTRIKELRKEANAQIAMLRERQREASGVLRRLSGAAGDSWRDIKDAGDRTLGEARAAASAIVERFRHALER
jgi:septal ring factor EnvC (AmiA/AmiB activator)